MTDQAQTEEPGSVDLDQVKRMIPHRYPLLLIDKVVDIFSDKSAVGIKNVTANEPQFEGHFPTLAIMPGVYLVESMAQTAAVLVVYTLGPDAEGKLVYFMTIDNARFRRPVVPGDVMRVQVSKLRQRGPIWKFRGEVMIDDKLAAEAEFSAMIRDE